MSAAMLECAALATEHLYDLRDQLSALATSDGHEREQESALEWACEVQAAIDLIETWIDASG